jgi:hypothetical protein
MAATVDHPSVTSTDLLEALPGPPPTVVGTFGSRGPLACDGTHVEGLVAELRDDLGRRRKTSAESRRALLELWLDVEPFLTEQERASLGGPTFDVIFPDSGTPHPNR